MMYQLTTQDVTYQDYPIQYSSSPSTGIEDIDNIRDSVLSNWLQEGFRRLFSLIPLFKVDLSSIKPHFEIKNETSLIEEIFEKTIPEDMLEFDIVVRMPPMKEWSARVKVKSVEKATPRIVEPEGF